MSTHNQTLLLVTVFLILSLACAFPILPSANAISTSAAQTVVAGITQANTQPQALSSQISAPSFTATPTVVEMTTLVPIPSATTFSSPPPPLQRHGSACLFPPIAAADLARRMIYKAVCWLEYLYPTITPIEIKDQVTEVELPAYTDGFTDLDGCLKTTTKDVINPGDTFVHQFSVV